MARKLVFFVTEKENPLSTTELKEKILRCSQFPHKERETNYQSYWLKGEGYVKGSRDTLYRYDRMGIESDLTGKSILDLGAQLGAMSIEAARRGASPIFSLEYEPDFVDCARDLIRHNGMQVTFLQQDLTDVKGTVNSIKAFFEKNTVDIVFALSLTKHIKVRTLFDILNGFKWHRCYIEGHNCNKDLNTPHCQDIYNNLVKRFKHKFMGFTEDRSVRPIWILDNRIKGG
jgi:hypothetical protein